MAFREVSVNEIREVRRLWLGVAGLPGEPDVRRHTNIPAVATAGVPDALHREPGTAMISALGFTADHYAAARRTSGERAWASLYLGVPSSPEGGLVKRVWLDQWRMACAPTAPVHTVIGVDPADSGQGGDCGIVAASLTRDGVVAVIADKSARMTSDAWARAAVERQGRRTRERRYSKACSNSMRHADVSGPHGVTLGMNSRLWKCGMVTGVPAGGSRQFRRGPVPGPVPGGPARVCARACPRRGPASRSMSMYWAPPR